MVRQGLLSGFSVGWILEWRAILTVTIGQVGQKIKERAKPCVRDKA